VAEEDDLAYGPMVGPDPDRPASRLEDWTAWVFADAFGPEAARRQAGLPLLNCGVWAAAAASPLWGLWAQALEGAWASAGHYRFFADQAAFNRVVHESLPGFARLPAWCNWLCHRAWPLAGPWGDLLVPRPPHRRLGIVHRAGDTKAGLAPLPTLGGDRVRRSLACPWALEGPA
jgi:hypothetical protein